MTDRYILSLATENASLEVVGGKGRSLAEMANADLKVPGGYYVTPAAYKKFVEDNDLQSEIIGIAKTVKDEYTLPIDAASEARQN